MKGVDNNIMEQQELQELQEQEEQEEQEGQQEHEGKPIRFVILGTPYTIKPTEELTAEAIAKLVDDVKALVESYLRKGFDEQRVPLLVAFHIADEKRRLQEKYELPLYRIVERLQFAIEEDPESASPPVPEDGQTSD